MREGLALNDRFVDYMKEAPNFLSVFIFSMFYNIASPMLLDISQSTNIPVINLNLIFTFYTVGAIVGQLTSVLYNRKFSKLKVVIAGYALMLPLILILLFNYILIIFYILYLLSGYVLGVIWIQANEFVLENQIKNKERIMTILLSFYPIAALISPLISSNMIKAGLSWRYSFYIIIFLILLNVLLYILIYLKKEQGISNEKKENINLRQVFNSKTKNIVFLLVFFAVIFYCYSETIIATWVPTYLRQVKNFDIQSASLALTLFWLFIIIGRGISIIIAGRIKTFHILLFISIFAIASFSILTFLNSGLLVYIMIALSGLGYSAMFPLLVSTGSTIYEKGRGILATGIFIASNIGISAAPFFTKYASKVSPIFSVSLAFISMALVTLLIVTIKIFNSRNKSINF